MLGWWTIGRASGVGVTAALVAMLLWPLDRLYGEIFDWPLLAAAALAGLCGLSILVITTVDLLFHRRRGRRLRPVRAFDVVLGFVLVALGLVLIDDLAGQIGALARLRA